MIDYAHTQPKRSSKQLITSVVVFTTLFLIIALASNSDYQTLYGHSDAWKNCTNYYAVPCTENGELKTNLSDQEINSLYESDSRGEISLSNFEIKYLQAIDENN
ncbi:MAG: hypothetical protein Q7R95_11545 [bacterium]|nr:hypothetical protein [bacterium]